MNVPSVTFEEKFQDKCNDIKRTLMDYLNSLEALKVGAASGIGAETGANATAGSVTVPNPHPNGITLDINGYPIAPIVTPESTISKETLEPLYRMYMTTHYRLSIL
jgi:hypothetical protein